MGIQEEISEIKNLLKKKEEEGKIVEKKWKYPFGKKVSKGMKKKNFVTVQILYENGTIDFKKYQIADQTIIHDLIPRLAGAGYVMYHKNNPHIILPNWSVKPISPMDIYEKSMVDGSNTKGYKVLMDKMLKQQINSKTKIDGIWKWIIGLALAGLIVYAFLTGGGK